MLSPSQYYAELSRGCLPPDLRFYIMITREIWHANWRIGNPEDFTTSMLESQLIDAEPKRPSAKPKYKLDHIEAIAF